MMKFPNPRSVVLDTMDQLDLLLRRRNQGGRGVSDDDKYTEDERRLRAVLDRFVTFTAALDDDALVAVFDALIALSSNALSVGLGLGNFMSQNWNSTDTIQCFKMIK